MSKPRPGVCGRCGRAVLQPEKEPVPGWNLPLGDRLSWADYVARHGHFYGPDCQLVHVRCRACSLLDAGA